MIVAPTWQLPTLNVQLAASSSVAPRRHLRQSPFRCSLQVHLARSIFGGALVTAGAISFRRRFGRRPSNALRRSRLRLTRLQRKATEKEEEEFDPSELVLQAPAFDTGRTGILLLNIGTPATTEVGDVRDYLERFLSDDRVIELQPPLLKWIVLQAILLTRPKSSAANYKKIWDPVRGSPLLFHSQDLAKGLQEDLGDRFEVRIGMQYSDPTVRDALISIAESGVDRVVLVPMFPHYASGTTGSCLSGAYCTAAELYCTPFLSVLPPFYSHPSYLSAMQKTILDAIGPKGEKVDHILFSFHGVPEEQCSRTDTTGSFCNKSGNCCARLQKQNRNCYRAQCFETARLLARNMGLANDSWSIGFQSRLTLRGTVQWIRPYTDEAFVELAQRGVRKLAVVAPSFTADCVETLEELGITGQEEFREAGGDELVVIPCLNSSKAWVKDLAHMLREHLAATASKAGSDHSFGPAPVNGKVLQTVPDSGLGFFKRSLTKFLGTSE